MPTPKRYKDNADRQCAYRARRAQARQKEREAKGLPRAPCIPSMPAHPRWAALIKHARAALQSARDEMEDYANDRSDAWQESENAETLQERIAALDDLIDQLDGFSR